MNKKTKYHKENSIVPCPKCNGFSDTFVNNRAEIILKCKCGWQSGLIINAMPIYHKIMQ